MKSPSSALGLFFVESSSFLKWEFVAHSVASVRQQDTLEKRHQKSAQKYVGTNETLYI